LDQVRSKASEAILALDERSHQHVSTTLDTDFCLEALDVALRQGPPVLFNTGQGAQFSSHEWTHRLKRTGVLGSMDSRGQALGDAPMPSGGSSDSCRIFSAIKIFAGDYTIPRVDAYPC
jgi:hypothetical protein